MAKKRSIMNMAINKPDDFVHFIMNDYLTKNGFEQKQVDGELVWQHGIGALTSPKFLTYAYQDGWIHIEAWLKVAILPGVYGSEMDLDGGYGFAVKAAYKDELNKLIALLNQPLPSDQVYQQPATSVNPASPVQPAVNNGQPTSAGQPYVSANAIPVVTTDNKGKAVAALITGIVSIPASIIPLLGLVAGITSIALAGPGKHSSKKGCAVGGMVCGIIGVVLAVIMWILNIVVSFL